MSQVVTTGFPKVRRPKQYRDPREHTAVMAAIEAYRAGLPVDKPFYLVVRNQAAGKAARKRMWRMARAEGYQLKTQVAQPKAGEWDVVYVVTGVVEGEQTR